MRLRPITDSDLPALDRLNRAAVPNVNDVGVAGLRRLTAQAAFFHLAEDDSGPLGFLLAMTPEADYDSPNFLWFKERYPDFCYIDRVVVSENARRLGVGSALYQAVIDFSGGRAPVLTCEVNLRPANPGSLAFHERFGFRQVGAQDTENGKKTVSLMIRPL
ncbi:GNAT family N-acetyltransferase [Desulfovibrio aminophilus]|nr:GNAT family N-acetyltransferase [Desulfovibrio aminophilus]MCM0754316.1 GNAT family N-acetyltransferase [Desulfovibrio aminophilus]